MVRKDIVSSLVIGELCSLFIILIIESLQLTVPFWQFLPLVLPIVCLLGVFVAYLIGKKFPVIYQIAKFLLVGIFNTLVDFGVLNFFLIFVFGVTSGALYTISKIISFLVAATNSYFWNKIWTFSHKKASSVAEAGKFFLVTGIGFGINVLVASFIVNVIGPQFDISAKLWANLGAFIAAVVVTTWNFLGYKLVVFKE